MWKYYVLIQYVPDPMTKEAINIGLILLGEEETYKVVIVQNKLKVARVLCIDEMEWRLDALISNLKTELKQLKPVNRENIKFLGSRLVNGIELRDAQPISPTTLTVLIDRLLNTANRIAGKEDLRKA